MPSLALRRSGPTRRSGRAVPLGKPGLPDFQALRRELGNGESRRLIYHAFDLLFLNGRDLRPGPFIERKHLLKELLEGAPATLVFLDYLEAEGQQVFEHACRMGL